MLGGGIGVGSRSFIHSNFLLKIAGNMGKMFERHEKRGAYHMEIDRWERRQSMQIVTEQLYENNPHVTVTSYILDNFPEIWVKSRGAVIICPGGGYFGCSDREAEPIALRFAGMGYHAFVVRYSTYTQGEDFGFPDLSKPLAIKKEKAHPAPMQDLARAVLYVRSHAEQWHIDREKLAICGFSAGGHNCAMYSVYWNKPELYDAVGARPEDLKVAACILGYPLTDYVYMNEHVMAKADAMGKAFFAASNRAFLGLEESEVTDEVLESVSPARMVTADTPPTFLWGTAGDSLVPPAHATLMATALAKAGVPFEIHTFETGDHGLSTSDWVSAAAKDQINADATQWIPLVEKFLARRFTPAGIPEHANYEVSVV